MMALDAGCDGMPICAVLFRLTRFSCVYLSKRCVMQGDSYKPRSWEKVLSSEVRARAGLAARRHGEGADDVMSNLRGRVA